MHKRALPLWSRCDSGCSCVGARAEWPDSTELCKRKWSRGGRSDAARCAAAPGLACIRTMQTTRHTHTRTHTHTHSSTHTNTHTRAPTHIYTRQHQQEHAHASDKWCAATSDPQRSVWLQTQVVRVCGRGRTCSRYGVVRGVRVITHRSINETAAAGPGIRSPARWLPPREAAYIWAHTCWLARQQQHFVRSSWLVPPKWHACTLEAS